MPLFRFKGNGVQRRARAEGHHRKEEEQATADQPPAGSCVRDHLESHLEIPTPAATTCHPAGGTVGPDRGLYQVLRSAADSLPGVPGPNR